jgi:hypothetical protein
MSSDITESITPDSSNVKQVWYNKLTQELTVEFKGNRKYKYSSVQETTWEEIKVAESVGKFITQNIVDCYPTDRLN